MIPHSRPAVGPEEAAAVKRVVLSGQLAQGPETARLEDQVARITGRAHGVAVSSGSTGLTLALLALGVGTDAEVIVTTYACTALIHAVRAVGATPVPADIDLESRNLDPDAARARLSSRTRALIVPHMFGLPARLPELLSLGVAVVEDCAMCLGTTLHGRPVGGWGALAVCSFYATKLVTTGEGGMVLADDEALAGAVRERREYDGRSCSMLRGNAKMTDLAAAMGQVQMRRLPDFLERRRDLAARYRNELNGLSLNLPPDVEEHAYFRYVVSSSWPAGEAVRWLERRGVRGRRPVPRLLHRELGYGDEEFPAAVEAQEHDVSLPLYPALSDGESQRVTAAARAWATCPRQGG